MLIVAASFALAVAATATAAEPLSSLSTTSTTSSTPPMLVSVEAASDIPARLVAAIVAETDAVWRGTGIQFFWQRAARDAQPASSMPTPYRTPILRVQIGHETHGTREWTFPLGWIVFDDPQTPEQEIYLSYENALTLLDKSDGVVGPTRAMPQLQREALLARALGRSLAHEIGHYLLASKVHTEKGLMMAVHSAFELFGIERVRFGLAPSERERMVERFTSIYMASRG